MKAPVRKASSAQQFDYYQGDEWSGYDAKQGQVNIVRSDAATHLEIVSGLKAVSRLENPNLSSWLQFT